MILKDSTPLKAAAVSEIFYPETDGMPLPDGAYQLEHFLETLEILKRFFRAFADVLVSGNTFIYYEEGNPRALVSPDCYVAFGVDVGLYMRNDNYRVWDMGKPPDFALEIGSASTARNDVGEKRELYARLGIGEYWRFDPSGGEHYGYGLLGERLVDGEYVEMEMSRELDGRTWGFSPTLNLELHWDDGRLRFYDPVGVRWLESAEETEDRAKLAEARLAELEAELRRLGAG